MQTNPDKRNDAVLAFLPLLVGVVAFLLVVGPRALDPTNISWLGEGDPATHYLGWLFFRGSPWSFPLGLNPGYGLELSNAILYSDSNPLLAFLFRPFSSLLPAPFQYFGLWLLACFCLQAWFGWKLLGLITDNVAIRLLGTGLFVFSPPMIWRLQGHFSLVGHFFIISALYFAFNPKLKNRSFSWGVLLVLTALVHAYLLAMVALIWLADLTEKALKKNLPVRESAIELIATILAVGLACWQAGYFSVGGGVSAEGYGLFHMNVLSMFDSNGWSYFFRDIPGGPNYFEGYNFLGAGLTLLFVCVLPVLVSGRVKFARRLGKHLGLLVVLLGLSAFAVSNKIGFGSHGYEFPLPEFMLQLANVFRASGRMFWPAFYTMVFVMIFLVVRGYKQRVATLLLGFALSIQIVDASVAWAEVRKRTMMEPASGWSTTLIEPFWLEAAAKYERLRYIPVGNEQPSWRELATYAGVNGLATDVVYLARTGKLATENAERKAAETLRNGSFESETLYIFDDRAFRRASLGADTSKDLLALVDGFNVIAPGWKSCTDCRRVEGEVNPKDLISALKPGERIAFNDSGSGAGYLGVGWSGQEAWGVWSDGSVADVFLPLPPGSVDTIVIEANAFIGSPLMKQYVELMVNTVPAEALTLKESEGVFEIRIPEAAKKKARDGILILEFNFPNAVRPKDIGAGEDRRKLALGLVAITVQ